MIGIAEFVFTSLVERETVHVGSFLIVFAAFGGLELYGLTGALLGVLGVVVLVAILDELGRGGRRAPTDGAGAAARARPPIPRRE